MSSRTRVFATSVGTKLLIGMTGLALFLYLLIHIAGNAVIFFGPTTFNQYAHALMSNPLVPVIEIGLVLFVITLIVNGLSRGLIWMMGRRTPTRNAA